MTGPSQGRPSTVPLAAPVNGASRLVFLGSQDGSVYAINADTGALAWVKSLAAVWQPGTMVQAAPSGMFVHLGGNHDYILVGTRYAAGDNAFFALNLSGGSVATGWPFWNGGLEGRIGIINDQATVDYANKRVYFTSFARGAAPDNNTVWCVDLDTGLVIWAEAYDNVTTSPTLRGNRLYFGRLNGPNNGEVVALNATTGAFVWTLGGFVDGPVKGFVMADRLSPTGDLYFSTTTKVRAFQDSGAFPAPKWVAPRMLPSPSTPIIVAGGTYLYVGGGDGKLYRLDTSDGSDAAPAFPLALGDGTAGLGSPSIDIRQNFLYVGAEDGVIYAVALP
jgi:outer membrane protein assembly factor BamB